MGAHINEVFIGVAGPVMKPVFQWVYTSQPQRTTAPAGERATAAAKPDRPSGGISDRIEQAFDAASSQTGTPFEYLVKTAQRESAMNPAAKAPTSSAAGLFQFIESTWLETIKTEGARLGLGDVADRITVENGRYRVEDPAERKAILEMRHDPEIASMMAGALTRRNAGYLSGKLGRDPSVGELYIAHFLGAKGASQLIGLAGSEPDASAAAHFPKQASANKSIFYDRNGARSVAEVYAELVSQHGGHDAPAFPSPVMTAYADDGATPVASDPAARVLAGWKAAEPTDAFSALFRTDSPAKAGADVSSFWRGYAMAPALFDVARAEDAKAFDAAQPVSTGSPSLAARAEVRRSTGPLDLSQFLDTDEG